MNSNLMPLTDPIEIPFIKRGLTILIIAGGFCFLLGLWLVVYPPPLNFYFLLIPINKTLLGVALMAFWAYYIPTGIVKITSNKPGLTIDSKGVTDNVAFTKAGQVLWTDVQEIKTTQAGRQTFIILVVKNPEEYIGRQTGLKRKIMQGQYKNHGSPVMISVTGLNCNVNELMQTLQYKHKEALRQ